MTRRLGAKDRRVARCKENRLFCWCLFGPGRREDLRVPRGHSGRREALEGARRKHPLQRNLRLSRFLGDDLKRHRERGILFRKCHRTDFGAAKVVDVVVGDVLEREIEHPTLLRIEGERLVGELRASPNFNGYVYG